jgi:protein SCO1/2
MNANTITRRAALRALAAAACAPLLARAAVPMPGDSIYRLPATLADQHGRSFELSSLRGTPMLFSMFYTSCEMVCPMIFETIEATRKALHASAQPPMRVLMVSFDPARDTVAALKKTATAHGCDDHWTLARTDDATVRKIAAVMGVQYRKLSNGEFNHSTLIDVLDKRGRIVARSGKLGSVDLVLVNAAKQAASVDG